jgi:hypothetical protein
VNFGNRFPRKIIVGQCIYCGRTDEPLHREHIVPRCLGGSWILYKASCPKCEGVTREFEGCIAADQALVIRTLAKLPTRPKNGWPKSLPLKVTRAGQEEIIDCPVEMYPIRLTLETYPPPACIDKRPYVKGIDILGVGFANPSAKVIGKLRDRFQIDDYNFSVTLQGLTQARLLAKIALGFAVAAYGAKIIKHSYIRRAVLGQSEDIGKWVGCFSRPAPEANVLHQVRLSIERDNNIHAYVRLFARYGTPEYLIVVGPAP